MSDKKLITDKLKELTDHSVDVTDGEGNRFYAVPLDKISEIMTKESENTQSVLSAILTELEKLPQHRDTDTYARYFYPADKVKEIIQQHLNQ